MPRKAKDTVTIDMFTKPPLGKLEWIIDTPLKGMFLLNGVLHMQVQPSKWMMNSTLIYENTMKGNIFAVDMENNKLVMLKPDTAVIHVEPSHVWELVKKEN